MALSLKDRVRESSSTTGTGTITLAGAYVGFQTFSSTISDGDTVYYTIHNTAPGYETEWEVGLGTFTLSGTTLSRDTILSSSNAGSAVDFNAGTKEVFITQPAEKAVFEDGSNNVTVGGKITVGADPTADLEVATKQYVDNAVAAALHYHDPVRVESPTALTVTYNNGTAGVGATLTNAGTQAALVLDGITLNVADRVLIYTQTNATQNGVYTVTNVGSGSTNWVLTRATDADSYAPSDPNSFGQGDAFYVQEGATGAGESYVLTTQGTITFGTTNITFSQFSATPAYTGGTNINVTAQTISLTGTVAATNGGTGNNSYTTGDILYSNSANSLAKLAGNTTTTAKYLTQTGNGSISAAPTWTALAASATTNTTNASNISSGTLASARISGSYTGITGVGTLTAGTWNASTVGAAYGGTGLTSYAVGDIVYASGSTTLSKLAGVATGNVLLSGGVATAPSYGKVGLTTHVSGTLPIANGGTNSTTATGAFDNLAPAQTGNSGKYLTTNGSTTSWAVVPAPNNGTLTMAVSGTGLSGSASFTADQSGNSTFTVTSNATSANTASTVVARDASGNFTAGTITAALSGNATTATTASATTATLTRGSYLTGSNFNGSAATTWAVDATSANTVSKVVARDASGNFSAGTITAALSGNASTATTLQTARNIGGVSFNGSADINLPGVNTAGNQNTSGNAATATTLATARAINGVSFNGSADITVTANTTNVATFNNSGTGDASGTTFDGSAARTISYNTVGAPSTTGTNASGTWAISITGNADTATTAATATNATNVALTNTATNANFYIPFASGNTTGNYAIGVDSGLYYNPSINWLFTTNMDVTSLYPAVIDFGDGTGSIEHLRFGSSDDAKFFYDGTNNTMEMELEAAANSFIITDNGTTKFTFTKSTGNLAATSFTGDLTGDVTGNADTATSATSATTFTSTTQDSQFNSIGVGTAASGTAGEIRATNNITAYYSDDRLKTKLGEIENALDKIDTLSGFYYEANQTAQDLGYDVVREVGVSAQSVQAIMPEVVAPAPIDEKYLTVRYERLVPLLIQGIKELRAEIKALKGE